MASRSVRLTSPERVLFPDEGITKQDMFEYYRYVAPVLVHLRNRPFTMKRSPYGVGGDVYFQKQAPKGMPSWIPTRTYRTYPREGRVAARRLPARQLAGGAALDGADELHRHERLVLARRQAAPSGLRPLRPRPARRWLRSRSASLT